MRAALRTNTNLAKLRGLAAINRVRRGLSKSLSQAAKAESTTVSTIRRLLPAALLQDRRGGRIRVKAGDPYSARVEVVTDQGIVHVNARGSRQRELAGRHRAVLTRVLRDEEPSSTLEQFRGKKVGDRELISDFDRLTAIVRGGELDQLENLYVSPGVQS